MKLWSGTRYSYGCVCHIISLLYMIPVASQITLTGQFYLLSLINNIILCDGLERCIWNDIARLMFYFWVDMCIIIFVSYTVAPEMFTVVINMERTFLSVALKPSKTSLTCPKDPMPRLIIILYACANMYSKYNSVAYFYWSEQPSELSQMVLISEKIRCIFFNR